MAEAARDKTTEFNKQTEPLRIEQAKKVTSKFFFLPSQKWHFHSRTNQTTVRSANGFQAYVGFVIAKACPDFQCFPEAEYKVGNNN
jgi:hypothetical protein